ncbi:hypothetical protein PGTUg99_028689 [Puccinia graminis f. sp. tritici]|uniref:Uncharacterized protein n=1 Tax=Puccinia graminis f. sp. tritici TaxID=56615 RepID=A0A5B0RMC5_PUCGR|nr:hypothetical protein PGTUg99_028689 [Puccinia graminis f. sp. tritici]
MRRRIQVKNSSTIPTTDTLLLADQLLLPVIMGVMAVNMAVTLMNRHYLLASTTARHHTPSSILDLCRIISNPLTIHPSSMSIVSTILKKGPHWSIGRSWSFTVLGRWNGSIKPPKLPCRYLQAVILSILTILIPDRDLRSNLICPHQTPSIPIILLSKFNHLGDHPLRSKSHYLSLLP